VNYTKTVHNRAKEVLKSEHFIRDLHITHPQAKNPLAHPPLRQLRSFCAKRDWCTFHDPAFALLALDTIPAVTDGRTDTLLSQRPHYA